MLVLLTSGELESIVHRRHQPGSVQLIYFLTAAVTLQRTIQKIWRVTCIGQRYPSLGLLQWVRLSEKRTIKQQHLEKKPRSLCLTGFVFVHSEERHFWHLTFNFSTCCLRHSSIRLAGVRYFSFTCTVDGLARQTGQWIRLNRAKSNQVIDWQEFETYSVSIPLKHAQLYLWLYRSWTGSLKRCSQSRQWSLSDR